jgi:hypothetical protein
MARLKARLWLDLMRGLLTLGALASFFYALGAGRKW